MSVDASRPRSLSQEADRALASILQNPDDNGESRCSWRIIPIPQSSGSVHIDLTTPAGVFQGTLDDSCGLPEMRPVGLVVRGQDANLRVKAFVPNADDPAPIEAVISQWITTLMRRVAMPIPAQRNPGAES